ncbi:MAG: hypothetical protein AAFZ18_11505 [Myxococcota bacterium]
MTARARIALAVVGLVAAGVALRASGALDGLGVEGLRAQVLGWGWLGPLAYGALFAVGALLHLPGYLFVTAAALAYGPVGGALLAYAAAWLYVMASGGAARHLAASMRASPAVEARMGKVRASWAWRLLHRKPVVAVAALRCALPTNLALTSALVAADISPRAFILGSTLGLLPQVLITAALVSAATG